MSNRPVGMTTFITVITAVCALFLGVISYLLTASGDDLVVLQQADRDIITDVKRMDRIQAATCQKIDSEIARLDEKIRTINRTLRHR